MKKQKYLLQEWLSKQRTSRLAHGAQNLGALALGWLRHVVRFLHQLPAASTIRFPRLIVVRTHRRAQRNHGVTTAQWHVRRVQPLVFLWLMLFFVAGLTVLVTGLFIQQGSHPKGSEQLRQEVVSDPNKQMQQTAVDKLTKPQQLSQQASSLGITKANQLIVPVYLSKEKKVDRVPLEEYVLGVLAAEMPTDFELEALKAQALAARTYIVRRYKDQDFSGVPSKEAWVTDTVTHQAYLTPEQMKKQWGPKVYEAKLTKLTKAVNETAGLIITYGGKPINAVFFSVGNGYTENAEDYWSVAEPYLRSVSSPWDKLAPNFKETITLTPKSIVQKLGLNRNVSAADVVAGMKVGELTAGQRIKQVRIGGIWFTGRDVREKLGLRSSYFTWKVKGSSIEITTYGNGHGVGMSQWGANGMAAQGKTAEEIVAYYYQGIKIESDVPYLHANMN
ncbi:MAG: stage II sporulation protein D [Gorillibacterium sp.]|nr:stage II sporulation protein D [Gorillibacterium sp.]